MCGIVGMLRPSGPEGEARARIEAMADTLHHRGPDDAGYHVDADIALGFRRLSIIDLTTGNQPLWSGDGTVVAVCNGEIYNFRDLRVELEAKGHVFRTNSDIEVIPALYREYGPDFVTRLNGQFAFAIWDLSRKRLVLGRDHVGIAPLFYTRVGRTLLFASEIRALLIHPDVERRVDLTGLDQIVTFPGLISPRTAFAGVESLPPGHLLVVEDGGLPTLRKWWDLDYPTRDAPVENRSPEDWADELEAALIQAVRYRLQADVPVAAYLSGGLDSSLIAAMAGGLEPEIARRTFSIVFDDPDIDERAYQRLMAKRLGSEHTEVEIRPGDIVADLQTIVARAETPLRESYNACSLALSGKVHDAGLKVVLTGEGADELLGGYVGYRLDQERNGNGGGQDLEALMESQLRQRLWGDPDFFYEKTYSAFDGEVKPEFYAEPLAERLADFSCLNGPLVDTAQIVGRHPFHQRSYLDFKLRMADHLLADHGDRVSFANSVEARYPFLDVGVIDVVRRVPPALMVEDGVEKALLKRVARRYLPDAIVDRQKFSFVAPGSPALLRDGPSWVEDLLSQDRIERQGYFNPETVEYLKQTAREPGSSVNQTFEDDLLMIVLTFGIFLDTFQLPSLN